MAQIKEFYCIVQTWCLWCVCNPTPSVFTVTSHLYPVSALFRASVCYVILIHFTLSSFHSWLHMIWIHQLLCCFLFGVQLHSTSDNILLQGHVSILRRLPHLPWLAQHPFCPSTNQNHYAYVYLPCCLFFLDCLTLEDEGSVFLQISGTTLGNDTASHPRGPESSKTLLYYSRINLGVSCLSLKWARPRKEAHLITTKLRLPSDWNITLNWQYVDHMKILQKH